MNFKFQETKNPATAREMGAPHSGINDKILQVSFADLQHGLVRTPTSLLFTVDGGLHWAAVSAGQSLGDNKHFPYTFSLVALDGSHMAVMLKQGAHNMSPRLFCPHKIQESLGIFWIYRT